MANEASRGTLSHASLQQAAQWFVQLHDPQATEHERQRWQQWIE